MLQYVVVCLFVFLVGLAAAGGSWGEGPLKCSIDLPSAFPFVLIAHPFAAC